jgi:hypothetical protein
MQNESQVSLVILRLEIDDILFNTTDIKHKLEYKCKVYSYKTTKFEINLSYNSN